MRNVNDLDAVVRVGSATSSLSLFSVPHLQLKCTSCLAANCTSSTTFGTRTSHTSLSEWFSDSKLQSWLLATVLEAVCKMTILCAQRRAPTASIADHEQQELAGAIHSGRSTWLAMSSTRATLKLEREACVYHD